MSTGHSEIHMKEGRWVCRVMTSAVHVNTTHKYEKEVLKTMQQRTITVDSFVFMLNTNMDHYLISTGLFYVYTAISTVHHSVKC